MAFENSKIAKATPWTKESGNEWFNSLKIAHGSVDAAGHVYIIFLEEGVGGEGGILWLVLW